MQEILYQKADAGDSIIQPIQEALYEAADAGVSLLDSGCRILPIRQRMQESLLQTGDAGDFPSDS